MQFTSLTDTGKIRFNNEDYCTATKVEGYTVLILSDGMGGANCGEVASSVAVSTVLESFTPEVMKKLSLPEIPKFLKTSIKKTNKLLFELSFSEENYRGMGATLEVCLIKDDTLYIAHIGDSRVYCISPTNEIMQLTKDHSLVESMIDSGEISREEALSHPQKHIITRAIGTVRDIEADIICHPLSTGDTVLLCSDGLTNMLSDTDILNILTSDASLEDRAQELIKKANDAGGTDNISVVLACN